MEEKKLYDNAKHTGLTWEESKLPQGVKDFLNQEDMYDFSIDDTYDQEVEPETLIRRTDPFGNNEEFSFNYHTGVLNNNTEKKPTALFDAKNEYKILSNNPVASGDNSYKFIEPEKDSMEGTEEWKKFFGLED